MREPRPYERTTRWPCQLKLRFRKQGQTRYMSGSHEAFEFAHFARPVHAQPDKNIMNPVIAHPFPKRDRSSFNVDERVPLLLGSSLLFLLSSLPRDATCIRSRAVVSESGHINSLLGIIDGWLFPCASMVSYRDPWFLKSPRAPARSGCALRVYCFPMAGSGACMYHTWYTHLPETIEVCFMDATRAPQQREARETSADRFRLTEGGGSG